MERLESQQIIRFEEWRWKVSYDVPDGGMTDKERDAKKKADKSSKKERKSWKRKSESKKERGR